jgi:hypothetical protein
MDLDVLIKTEAELAGAKAVEQQLERDIGKAKALGLRYDEIEQKLVRVRALMATATKVDGNAINDQINAAEKLADAKLREQRIRENNTADQASYLSGLTKETKELGETTQATDKATGAKSRLFDGLKKLGNQIPLVGALLGALRNPFTLIALGAVLAKRAIDDYAASVDRMADSVRAVSDLQGQVQKFFEIVAQDKAEAKAFSDELNSIATRAKTAAERLSEVNDQIERKFRLEEEADQRAFDTAVAGVKDPQRRAEIEKEFGSKKRTRDDRKAFQLALAKENAARAMVEEAAEADAALPGAQAERAAAARALKDFDVRRQAEDDDAASRKQILLDEKNKLEDELATPLILRTMFNFGGKTTSDEELEERLEANGNERNAITAAASLRDADRVRLQAEFAAADKRVGAIKEKGRVAKESARSLGFDAAAGFRAIDQERQANPLPPGPIDFNPKVQARADAIIAHNRQQAVRNAANDLEDAVVQAAKGIVSELLPRLRALEANSRRQNND